MLEIRAAQPTDKAAISAMAHRCYSDLLAGHYPADTLQAALPHMSDVPAELLHDGRYFVAHIGRVLVGAGGWSGADDAQLRKFAVDPAYLRRGVATALLKRTHQSARQAAVLRITCTATIVAVPFYQSMGYVKTGETTIDTGADTAPFHAVVLERVFE